jgi:hypothetical protein
VIDHLAQVRQLRALAGEPRSIDELVDGMHSAARKLESLIGHWRTFSPRPRAIQDVENLIEGLRRNLHDLRLQASRTAER